jgi:hypothetical protein
MMGGTPQQHGEKIADYATYQAAQQAVSQLIAADVPARDIAIVGYGLRSVETVTGKLGYAAAARSGAINGILLGLLFSAIFVLGTPNAAIQLFVGVMFVGISIGMLLSIVSYALLRRRRDFTSVTQVLADRYEVTVLPNSLHRAREIVGRVVAPVVASAPAVDLSAPAVDLSAPPQYGERIDPAPDPGGRPAPGPDAPSSPQPAPGPDAPAVPTEPSPADPTEPSPADPKTEPADEPETDRPTPGPAVS